MLASISLSSWRGQAVPLTQLTVLHTETHLFTSPWWINALERVQNPTAQRKHLWLRCRMGKFIQRLVAKAKSGMTIHGRNSVQKIKDYEEDEDTSNHASMGAYPVRRAKKNLSSGCPPRARKVWTHGTYAVVAEPHEPKNSFKGAFLVRPATFATKGSTDPPHCATGQNSPLFKEDPLRMHNLGKNRHRRCIHQSEVSREAIKTRKRTESKRPAKGLKNVNTSSNGIMKITVD